MLIDTHCHLDFPEFDADREAVITRAQEQGIEAMVNIGSSLKATERSLQLALQYDFIYASAGIHPHEADKFSSQDEQAFLEFLKQKKVVAVGEIGLDYFKNYSRPQNQKTLFRALLKLAKERNLPLIIHSRQAEQDTIEILKEFEVLEAVVHCFSYGADFLKECLDLGFFVSFTCNITYKKAEALRDLVRVAPLERLLLETDAPFLPPEEFRGQRNEPLYVRHLAREIARIKEISLDEVARVTTHNAKKFFRISS
ncbi:MAG: hydrolase TatD [Omnitrophica WOR_2 bacterium SM23_72]|nr:MAG: hydrolase TatD [Omnitrophica WOR_2 bacterium SM23_72]